MSILAPYRDRIDAGRQLADALRRYAGRDDVLVLALPRGGVPVAREVARALGAPLDILVVRKLGLPGQEELAIGAVASGGAFVLNENIIRVVAMDEATIEQVRRRETAELERRERSYRPGDRPPIVVRGRCIILIDDGLATGATVRAAIAALRQQEPSRIVLATPVAPPDTIERLRGEVDEIVCPATPEPFGGVGRWYEDFAPITDEQVREMLE